ncbi:MAG: hypothetical protein B7Z08_06230 [Sphingomonadales bacterium 32-68-7]|nr:MAG: hypothetical protein B7Z33_08140 [Sphingomonadales bacterium 12-68-11]OYX09199.1 MAG: hypothetical protein B7Z08_06230 [Sphingomonadales bacterium 32-68-7]
MILAILGVVLLFRASLTAMFSLYLVATLFGGSAAILLGSLGGSSIPPAQFALIFVALRCVLPGQGQMATLREAVWHNRFLVLFVLYGVISAFTLPILFANMMDVTPLKSLPRFDLFAVQPLAMTSQNVTTAVYLTGTMFAGISACAAMSRPGAAERVVRLGAAIAITHALLGISSVVLAGTAWDDFLQIFRNGNYAQLDQSFGDLARMNGIWPEPSGYAAYGGVWCVFMIELWFRNVLPKLTGPAGLLLLFALIGSTSSTAYVSLGAYAVLISVRFAIAPWNLPARKQLAILAVALFAAVAILTLFVIFPDFVRQFGNILALMTIEKGDSASGLQRAFWAKQGIDAFVDSYGLGIGAGSFRSSSLLTAILGSMGVIGAVCFLAHVVRALQPFNAEFVAMRLPTMERAVGCAAATTALVMLAPQSVASPSPDPGTLWAVMCGIAIALRLNKAPRPRPVARPAFAQ